MKARGEWTAMPDCGHNNGVNCDGPHQCKNCGWSPTEHKRRVNMIHAGLSKNKDGKKYLRLPKRRDGRPNAL